MSGEPDVAIVHEWLTNLAGSEQCVDAMREAFPLHRIYTSVLNPHVFTDWQSRSTTSVLQRIPALRSSHLAALPLMLPAMRGMRLDPDHDLVIRSFHTFATAPVAPAGIPELVYCYTPPRFIYRRGSLSRESSAIRLAAYAAARALRSGDQRRMRSSQLILAISDHVSCQIKSAYGLQSEVVYPPVDVERFRRALRAATDDYFLFVSRLVPYKRPDIAIEAFRSLPQHRLVVAGEGRLRSALERTAPPNVSFVGRISNASLPLLVGAARGFVFPAEEDFGIAPVEALAAGTPVAALGRGGALEYIQHGRNGLLVEHQTPDAFAAAIRTLSKLDWDRADISATSTRFSRERFIGQMRAKGLALLGEAGRGG